MLTKEWLCKLRSAFRRVAMRVLSLLDPFDPIEPTDPKLSRDLALVTFAFSMFSTFSTGIAGRGATDALRGGAGDGESPNVILDICNDIRDGRAVRVTGVSSVTVFCALAFRALPSIIVAIVARSEANSVDALSSPREERFFISAFRASTPARILEKLIFPAASVISRIFDFGVAPATA